MTDVATLTSEDFERRTEQLRRELLAHCYQMLGSVQDAEDVVQETMLRAWRARDQFDESRASLRTWMYKIATNACLTHLSGRARRALPSGIGEPWDDPWQPLASGHELPWLQPFPDSMLAADPASALLASGRLRLALVAAMQVLPPRQRAILILREALGLPGLQRARARLDAIGLDEDQVGQPADADARATVDRYVTAFQDADIAGLKRLLADDAILEMPPFRNWYAGRDDYLVFIERVFALRGTDWRMLPIAANGQPGVAAYTRVDGRYQLHTLQVFSVTAGSIGHTVVFGDPAIFGLFGLNPSLPA
jgi:RNA polymerase sigma-70 factor (ECF subfamily)